MVNEVAKRLIFRCFPNHSGIDTLKNTLTCKISYCRFVATEIEDTSPLASTCLQILLGDNAFISAHQQSQRIETPRDTPRSQRRAVTLSLEQFRARYSDRDVAMARAYLSTAFTMSHIASAFRVSSRTVSRTVSAFSKAQPAADRDDQG